ncbi:MAG: helix-turn-helix transcriptional regulator [Actinobacteria bacterium]|nr:helix-turn-helix transcriptional regulator [Actinomycetota bacterium]
MPIDKDLVAALATPLVLAILVEGPSYGYAIVKRVRELSDGELEWSDGMLYPLLHRLEKSGHVRAEWGASDTGRKRRNYHITESGRAELADQRRQWDTANRTLGGLWGMTVATGEA